MDTNTAAKLALLTMTTAAFACGEDIDSPSPELESLEIVDNLKLAGYPAGEIDLQPDGTVYVGLDAEVSLEASREMVGLDPSTGEADSEGFRQYRTTNTIAPSLNKICVDGSLYTGAMSSALTVAISKLNALDLSFSVQRTAGTQAGCNAYITAKLQAGYGGLAGFPSLGKPYSQILVGTSIPSYYGTTVTAHVILHELGHCLGLRHSDYYDRTISCGAGGGSEAVAPYGAHHIPGTPSTAVMNGSVMNSCYNAGSNGLFSSGDVTALETVYPDLSCAEDCDDEYDDCQVDFCYWDYNAYMCNEGCNEDYLECLSDC